MGGGCPMMVLMDLDLVTAVFFNRLAYISGTILPASVEKMPIRQSQVRLWSIGRFPGLMMHGKIMGYT